MQPDARIVDLAEGETLFVGDVGNAGNFSRWTGVWVTRSEGKLTFMQGSGVCSTEGVLDIGLRDDG